jgi:hypothetical protein
MDAVIEGQWNGDGSVNRTGSVEAGAPEPVVLPDGTAAAFGLTEAVRYARMARSAVSPCLSGLTRATSA